MALVCMYSLGLASAEVQAQSMAGLQGGHVQLNIADHDHSVPQEICNQNLA